MSDERIEVTTAVARPQYTPAYDEKGRRVEIQGMAGSSIRYQWYKVSICDGCGRHVAWAQSKAGKWYVCETAEYRTAEAGHERFRAVPYKFHQCDEAMVAAVAKTKAAQK